MRLTARGRGCALSIWPGLHRRSDAVRPSMQLPQLAWRREGMDRREEAVLAAVDEEACAQMTMDLVNIPSPPGDEQALGDYLANRFAELGMAIEIQEVEQRRNNVIATLAGEGSGDVLLFSGHEDTSTTGDDEALGPGHQASAAREGEWIYGLGASNMKAA